MSADRDVKQGVAKPASWNRLFPLEHPNGHHFGLKYPGGLGGQSPLSSNQTRECVARAH